MPCTPKKTTVEIVESGNHYVLQVKKNQKYLQQEMMAIARTAKVKDSHECHQKAHGRRTSWSVTTFDLQQEHCPEGWKNLKTLIVTDKRVIQKVKANKPNAGKETLSQSTSYRISDLNLDAKEFHKGIRGHWGIENRLHWVKDVNFNEDHNRIKNKQGAVNMSIFTTLAINYLRENIDDSIKTAQIIFGQNVKELLYTIRT